MEIDLTQLRTFVAVAEEQHLTRAAERLHISQSSASAHVRAVEDTVGMQLFARTQRSLELTEAGRLLMRKAVMLLNESTLFTSFARELQGKVEGTLRIGAGIEPTLNRMAEIVAALRHAHPLVHVELRGGHSMQARQGLKTGELDASLMLGELRESGFSFQKLTTVYYRIAGTVEWKDRIENADWAEIAQLPWLVPPQSSLSVVYGAQTALFARRGLKLNIAASFDNAVLGREMVSSGMGVSLVREEFALDGERSGQLAVSPLARVGFPLVMAYLEGRRNEPVINALIDAARSVWPQLSDEVGRDSGAH